jgi:hypothetical protein
MFCAEMSPLRKRVISPPAILPVTMREREMMRVRVCDRSGSFGETKLDVGPTRERLSGEFIVERRSGYETDPCAPQIIDYARPERVAQRLASCGIIAAGSFCFESCFG